MAGFYDSVSGRGILQSTGLGDQTVDKISDYAGRAYDYAGKAASSLFPVQATKDVADWGKQKLAQGIYKMQSTDEDPEVQAGTYTGKPLADGQYPALANSFPNQGDTSSTPATDAIFDAADQGILARKPVDPNSQEGGAQAKAEQQSQIDKASQATADSAVDGGGVPANATQDPAQALAQRNQNQQAGTGNQVTGITQKDMPPALTDSQQKNAGLDEAGQQEFQKMNTVEHWWDSSAFTTGMIQTGLALLDGKGYSESFNIGAKWFDDHHGQEQRKNWSNDLLQKGYDRQEVEEYVRTGNSKILTSPAQKAQKLAEQQMRMDQAQANLESTRLANQQTEFEQSPDERARKARLDQANVDYKVGLVDNQQQKLDLDKQLAPIKIQAANARLDTEKMKAQQALEKMRSTVTNKQGVQVRLGGTAGEGDQWHVVLNGSGGPVIQKGQLLVADSEGNNQHTISANPGASHMAENNARIAIEKINKFSHEGAGLFGPKGDILKGFGDFWGQRTSADQASRVRELQGLLEQSYTDALIIEQQGIRPSNVEIEHKLKAIGSLTNPDGSPSEISEDRAREIINSYRDSVAAILQSASAQASGRNPQLTGEDLAQSVGVGKKRQDANGVWWTAMKNGLVRDNIWKRSTNQSELPD